MTRKYKILYHMPFLGTLSAYRTIYNGYKNAFLDLGHEFSTLTSEDDLKQKLNKINPDIFITNGHYYYQKFIDYEILKEHRKKGLKVFTNIAFWDSPISKSRINEAPSLKDDSKTLELIKSGLLGDFFLSTSEQDDTRMEGFKKNTGYDFYTIPLAADKISLKYRFEEKFKADISFIGTNLPQKRLYFKEYLFPLAKKYDLKLYGQDWTLEDMSRGFIQKIGQYFNIKELKNLRKPSLKLEDEGLIYFSSTISVNLHEDYQRKYGGDCNERTFKIPLCEGFEITDSVSCIKRYFKEGEEMVIAENKKDWFEKIEYYLKNPEKRLQIVKKGKIRAEQDHTYHNRVKSILKIYEEIN